MSNKHGKVFTTLNYIEHFVILASAAIGCISLCALASLLGIPIGIASSIIGLNICAIKKKKKKHNKIVLLAKSKLNSLGFLISIALIDSNVSHDEFVSANVML